MNIKAIFSDFNGVIMDDRSLAYAASCNIFNEFNVPYKPTIDEWRANTGSQFMDFYRANGLPDITPEDLKEKWVEYIFAHWSVASVRPLCGDVFLLLRDKGLKTAIVSADTAPIIDRRIKENGLRGLFDEVYTDASPKKEYLVRALDKFGFKAEDVLFVEDSAEGIRAGNELGLVTVAFMNETSFGFHRDLNAANPRFRVAELHELVGLVNIIELANHLGSMDSGMILLQPKKKEEGDE